MSDDLANTQIKSTQTVVSTIRVCISEVPELVNSSSVKYNIHAERVVLPHQTEDRF